MIQAGQRFRTECGRKAHIVAYSIREGYSVAAPCGVWEYVNRRTANPDPTLPLCATCARRKDQA